MAPRKVYGKRTTRAPRDTFAAFVSPPRDSKKEAPKEDPDLLSIAAGLDNLKICSPKSKSGVARTKRQPLVEKSGNEGAEEQTFPPETRRKSRASGAVVSDEAKSDNGPGSRDSAVTGAARAPDLRVAPLSPEKENTRPKSPSKEPPRASSKHDDEYEQISNLIPPKPDPRPSDSDGLKHSNIYTSHCTDLLALANHPIMPFSDWTDQLTAHFTLSKIAEASFGEVYRLSAHDRIPNFSRDDESVVKIIALKPPAAITVPAHRTRCKPAPRPSTEAMSAPREVATEVRLLQRMTAIPGYTNFRDVRVLQGRPPAALVAAFRDFNRAQRGRGKEASIFPDPGRKGGYGADQLWAVIEMQDAGADLERCVEDGRCADVWAVWDVFWQVVLALAKGEEAAMFEHRDLHLGNICVRGATEARDGAVDVTRKLHFTRLEATLIDYTISRARLSDADADGAAGEPAIAHTDLCHPTHAGVFTGDSAEEYQYDIYRYMRGAVLHDDPYSNLAHRADGIDAWKGYKPVTNALWLHFTLYALLSHPNFAWPSSQPRPVARRNKAAHAAWKRAGELERVLLRLQDLLDPGVLCEPGGLGSATAVVGLALEKGWILVDDVVGLRSDDEHDTADSNL